jgi:predicted nucleic acid-binding protein
MSARLFIDTNVIVYAYDTANPEKQAIAQELLANAVLQGDAAVSAQVFGEFFHTVVVRRKLMTSEEAALAITAIEGGIEVAQITFQLVKDAIEIHERYQLRYWDSLIVATARHLGCREVASEDLTDGQDYGGVVVANPFKTLVGTGTRMR